MGPMLTIAARNGANSVLNITKIELLHRPANNNRSTTTSEWLNVPLVGPESGVSTPILGNKRVNWCTPPASLPVMSELKLVCNYKTADYQKRHSMVVYVHDAITV